MKPLTLSRLLNAAANTIELNADESRRTCYLAGRDWACGDCAPDACSARARWTLDMALVNALRKKAGTP